MKESVPYLPIWWAYVPNDEIALGSLQFGKKKDFDKNNFTEFQVVPYSRYMIVNNQYLNYQEAYASEHRKNEILKKQNENLRTAINITLLALWITIAQYEIRKEGLNEEL